MFIWAVEPPYSGHWRTVENSLFQYAPTALPTIQVTAIELKSEVLQKKHQEKEEGVS